MIVRELIEQLQAVDPELPVGAATECHGCSGTDVVVDVVADTVWITDRREL